MNKTINVTVRDRIAVNYSETPYVCGNSDFVVRFEFDEEWDAYPTKTARFKWGTQCHDQVFDGNECPVPKITDVCVFEVGVFAGDLQTTTAANVPAKKSILCGAGSPAAPAEDVYGQIMAKLNSLDGGLLVTCTPGDLIASGETSFTFKVTFDHTGAEVAEAIKTGCHVACWLDASVLGDESGAFVLGTISCNTENQIAYALSLNGLTIHVQQEADNSGYLMMDGSGMEEEEHGLIVTANDVEMNASNASLPASGTASASITEVITAAKAGRPVTLQWTTDDTTILFPLYSYYDGDDQHALFMTHYMKVSMANNGRLTFAAFT